MMEPLLTKVLAVLLTVSSLVTVTPELIVNAPVDQVTPEASQSEAYGDTEVEHATPHALLLNAPKNETARVSNNL